MQVRVLIEALRSAPADAHVVIGGDVVHGIEVRSGEIETGYYNPIFHFRANGKARAVVFLANVELSTGDVVSFPK